MVIENGWEVWDIENSSRVTKIEFKETGRASGIVRIGDLRLTFKNSGAKYLYHKVPRLLVLNAVNAPSVGKALNSIINNKNIKYEKVKEDK